MTRNRWRWRALTEVKCFLNVSCVNVPMTYCEFPSSAIQNVAIVAERNWNNRERKRIMELCYAHLQFCHPLGTRQKKTTPNSGTTIRSNIRIIQFTRKRLWIYYLTQAELSQHANVYWAQNQQIKHIAPQRHGGITFMEIRFQWSAPLTSVIWLKSPNAQSEFWFPPPIRNESK